MFGAEAKAHFRLKSCLFRRTHTCMARRDVKYVHSAHTGAERQAGRQQQVMNVRRLLPLPLAVAAGFAGVLHTARPDV